MTWLNPDPHQRALEAARDIALRRLDRSAVPRAALAQLLASKAVEPAIITEVLDRLQDAGLIDDRAYAATLVRTRFAEKGASRQVIARELQRKGLAPQDIEAALAQISTTDEQQAALALARKKVALTAHLSPLVQKRRTLAFLSRKGYSFALALEAYERAAADLRNADEQ